MACMCGDTYCWSCGPAQGNAKCSVCGKWEADGGCDNPTECEAKGKEEDRLYAEQEAEWAKAEAEWVNRD